MVNEPLVVVECISSLMLICFRGKRVLGKNEGRLLPGHSETDADKLSSSWGQNEHKNSLLI